MSRKDTTFEHLKRLLIIVNYIENHSCQVFDLCELTGKSVRTIKRDLDILRKDFHAPIVFNRKYQSFEFTRKWHIMESFLSEK